MKILSLDYGSKTIGVAVYDKTVDFVYPLETIWRKKNNAIRESLRHIDVIIEKENIKKIVVGLPITMKDTEGERARISRAFGEKLSLRSSDNHIAVYSTDKIL
ncbi:MAG: Holliday junction resolvase RuvX, partial [Lachnospiraceae bacterium]|nr:Holliday junction resolvase RuvX [Lachnospiraceae bacterium]